MQKNADKTSFLKVLLEFLPLGAFFATYKMKGIIFATAVLVVLSLFSMSFQYFRYKTISISSIISGLILVVFGGLTLYTQNPNFIKMKVSFINLLFAIILIIGIFFKNGLAKYIYGNMLELESEVWIKISVRWAFFFIFVAILNEIIWRNFDEEIWMKFKVFGLLPITMVFAAIQIYPYLKNNKPM